MAITTGEIRYREGDRVRCIDAGGQEGLADNKIYIVGRYQRPYLYLEGVNGGRFAWRFAPAGPNLDKELVLTILAVVRDTTNSQSMMDNAKRAIEIVEKNL